MRNFITLSLICVSFAVAAYTNHALAEAAAGIHVDVDEVAATRTVVPVDGVTSSGQPDEAALRVFADAGYLAVIDMRGPEEDRGLDNEQAVVEGLGMDYILLPLTSREQISFDTARELDEILQGIDGPVLVHCASGNRVGAVLALRHSLNGASKEESIVHGKNAGLTRLEDVVRERLGEN